MTKSTPFGSLDHPFNPLSVALGAEASFVARTHDMDRHHMTETFRRAHDHEGAAFVEIYQNCNVFNDGAFGEITSKEKRADMLIPLQHGEPIRFGADREKCISIDNQGNPRVSLVAEVGESAVLVHDEAREDPSLAFMLSRLAHGPTRADADRCLPRRQPSSSTPKRRHNSSRQRSNRRVPVTSVRSCSRVRPGRSDGLNRETGTPSPSAASARRTSTSAASCRGHVRSPRSARRSADGAARLQTPRRVRRHAPRSRHRAET